MVVEHIPEGQKKIAKKWECEIDPARRKNIRPAELRKIILSAIRDAIQQNATGLAAENKRLRERVEELEKAIKYYYGHAVPNEHTSDEEWQTNQKLVTVELDVLHLHSHQSDPQSGEEGKETK